MISGLAGGWFNTILDAIERGRIQLIVSDALLQEFRDVASRPRMRKWFQLDEAEDFAIALETRATLVKPSLIVTACRDPDDNYLLALSETAGAQYLVTRDEDLLVVKQWKTTAIVPPHHFLLLLKQVNSR